MTYFLALPIAAVVGAILQLVLTALKRTHQFGLGLSFGTALLINAATLINWKAVQTTKLLFLLADFIFLPVCSLTGVIVGTLPVIITVGLVQKLRRHFFRGAM